MTVFCKKCGNRLDESMKFCNKCGTPVAMVNEDAPRGKQIDNSTKDKGMMGTVIAIVVFLLLLGGGGYYILNHDVEIKQFFDGKEDDVIEKKVEPSTERSPQKEDGAVTSKQEDTDLVQAKKELEKYGFTCNAVATSYGNSTNGFLIVDKRVDGFRIMVVDSKNKRVAEAIPSYSLEKLDQMKTKSYQEPIIIEFLIFSDTRGSDAEYGAWEGRNHRFPIYAQYKFNQQGVIVPGMLTSGAGAHPSHYQGYLYEKRNVELANLFLEEALPLWENAKKHDIYL